MIDQFGKNLDILILTEIGKDWETFCTWYSFFKNLPEATVSISCYRNEQAPFQLYQWTKRLEVPCYIQNLVSECAMDNQVHAVSNYKLTENSLLVVPVKTVALDVLSPKILTFFNNKKAWMDNNVWFIQAQKDHKDLSSFANDYFFENNFLHRYEEEEVEIGGLCPEANETKELSPLVTYRKGCGKWIDTLKGCPFSSAAGLASTEMTVNETRIIELWGTMCGLYNAVA